MKKLFLSLVAIVAIAGAIGTREVAQAAVNSNPDLRVAVACSPLTNSQTVVAGDPQLCRMKFTNYSAFPITDISISRPSVNTLVSRYAFNSPSLVELAAHPSRFRLLAKHHCGSQVAQNLPQGRFCV